MAEIPKDPNNEVLSTRIDYLTRTIDKLETTLQKQAEKVEVTFEKLTYQITENARNERKELTDAIEKTQARFLAIIQERDARSVAEFNELNERYKEALQEALKKQSEFQKKVEPYINWALKIMGAAILLGLLWKQGLLRRLLE